MVLSGGLALSDVTGSTNSSKNLVYSLRWSLAQVLSLGVAAIGEPTFSSSSSSSRRQRHRRALASSELTVSFTVTKTTTATGAAAAANSTATVLKSAGSEFAAYFGLKASALGASSSATSITVSSFSSGTKYDIGTALTTLQTAAAASASPTYSTWGSYVLCLGPSFTGASPAPNCFQVVAMATTGTCSAFSDTCSGTITVYSSSGSSAVSAIIGAQSQLHLVDISTITTADLEHLGVVLAKLDLKNEDKGAAFLRYVPSYTGFLGAPSTGDLTSTCAIDPTTYGYNSAFDTAQFTFKYNTRTVITAVAVNLGYLPISALQEVWTQLTKNCATESYGLTLVGSTCRLAYGSDTFEVRSYVDSKYEYMDPVFCLSRTNRAYNATTDKFEHLCLVRVGDSFVLPFFSHMGSTAFGNTANSAAFFDPSYSCACSSGNYSSDYLDWTHSYADASNGALKYQYLIRGSQKSEKYCNKMDLMHGFVMHTTRKNTGAGAMDLKTGATLFQLQRYLQMASALSPQDIAKYAYVAAFMALRLSYGI